MFTIYLIQNKFNGKVYVGKTSKTPERRWIHHQCIARKGKGNYLHKAIRKYGQDSFLLSKLDNTENELQANWLESFYIGILKASNRSHGYNLTAGGEGVIANTETRKKISASLKRCGHHPPIEACRLGGTNSTGHRGHLHTDETKKRISNAKQGCVGPWTGKKFSEEHCQNMGLARIRRDVPDNEICDLYADGQSTYQIAKFYNVSPKTITWRLHRIGMQLRLSRRPKTQIIKEI